MITVDHILSHYIKFESTPMGERVNHVRDYYNPNNHKGDMLFRKIESEKYGVLDYCDIHTVSVKAGETLSLYCAEKYMASVQATWKCKYPIDTLDATPYTYFKKMDWTNSDKVVP